MSGNRFEPKRVRFTNPKIVGLFNEFQDCDELELTEYSGYTAFEEAIEYRLPTKDELHFLIAARVTRDLRGFVWSSTVVESDLPSVWIFDSNFNNLDICRRDCDQIGVRCIVRAQKQERVNLTSSFMDDLEHRVSKLENSADTDYVTLLTSIKRAEKKIIDLEEATKTKNKKTERLEHIVKMIAKKVFTNRVFSVLYED
jgi:hypothetical protein